MKIKKKNNSNREFCLLNLKNQKSIKLLIINQLDRSSSAYYFNLLRYFEMYKQNLYKK